MEYLPDSRRLCEYSDERKPICFLKENEVVSKERNRLEYVFFRKGLSRRGTQSLCLLTKGELLIRRVGNLLTQQPHVSRTPVVLLVLSIRGLLWSCSLNLFSRPQRPRCWFSWVWSIYIVRSALCGVLKYPILTQQFGKLSSSWTDLWRATILSTFCRTGKEHFARRTGGKDGHPPSFLRILAGQGRKENRVDKNWQTHQDFTSRSLTPDGNAQPLTVLDLVR